MNRQGTKLIFRRTKHKQQTQSRNFLGIILEQKPESTLHSAKTRKLNILKYTTEARTVTQDTSQEIKFTLE